VADDAAVLLGDAGQEAGDVDQGDQRDVERVAEPDELARLVGGVDVEDAGHDARLVRDDADAAAVDPAEADHDVLGVAGLDLEEVLRGRRGGDDLADVVALVARRSGRCRASPRRLDVGVGIDDRGVLGVVLRQEAEQLLGDQDGLLVVVGHEVVDAGDAMWASAPPSSSWVTSSPVTCLMTLGPVMNMWALRVWMMKSVSAGL
jgi:hypothetical protein